MNTSLNIGCKWLFYMFGGWAVHRWAWRKPQWTVPLHLICQEGCAQSWETDEPVTIFLLLSWTLICDRFFSPFSISRAHPNSGWYLSRTPPLTIVRTVMLHLHGAADFLCHCITVWLVKNDVGLVFIYLFIYSVSFDWFSLWHISSFAWLSVKSRHCIQRFSAFESDNYETEDSTVFWKKKKKKSCRMKMHITIFFKKKFKKILM